MIFSGDIRETIISLPFLVGINLGNHASRWAMGSAFLFDEVLEQNRTSLEVRTEGRIQKNMCLNNFKVRSHDALKEQSNFGAIIDALIAILH